MGCRWCWGGSRELELVEDFVEVVDAGVGGEPLGGADGSFGEGAARFGFVGEDEAVGGAGGDEGVDAFDVAGAVRGDGDVVVLAGSRWSRWWQRTASRRVRAVPLGASSFADVVGLGDGEGVAGVLEGAGHFFGELEHHLHADGEVGAVEESGLVASARARSSERWLYQPVVPMTMRRPLGRQARMLATTASGVVKSMTASKSLRKAGVRAEALGFSREARTRTVWLRSAATSATSLPVLPAPRMRMRMGLV